jgi:hypothetical protein
MPPSACFSLLSSFTPFSSPSSLFADGRVIGLEDLLYDAQEPLVSSTLPTEQQLWAIFEQHTERTGRTTMRFKEACAALFAYDPHLGSESNIAAIKDFFASIVSVKCYFYLIS